MTAWPFRIAGGSVRSRGSIATLARIHTRRDNSTQLAGDGIGKAAAFLAALTMVLD